MSEIDNLKNEVSEAIKGASAAVDHAPPRAKKIGLMILLGLFLFGGGLAAGRFGLPAKVVTKTEVKTETVTKTEFKDRIVVQKVYVKDQKKNQHTETTTTKAPDGTVVTKTVTDTKTDTDTHVDTNRVEYKDRIVEKLVEKIVEKEKIVTNMPNWMVQAGAGVAIPYYLGQDSPGVPGLRGVVIDAGLSRRIVGPFWLGVRANTQGVLGLQLSGTF